MPKKSSAFQPITTPEPARLKHNHRVAVLLVAQTANASKIKTQCGAVYPAESLERMPKMPKESDTRYCRLPIGPSWPEPGRKAATC